MRPLKGAICAVLLALAGLGAAQAQEEDPRVIAVTCDNPRAQAFSMRVAKEAAQQGQAPRILLCGAGAELALRDYEADPLQAAGAEPQRMMRELMDQGATVQVCSALLPNTDYTADALVEGVGVASPDEAAALMADPDVRYFSY